jgi:hypothetical protein
MVATTEAVKYIIENTVEGEMVKVEEVGYQFWIGEQMTPYLTNRMRGFHYIVTNRKVKVITASTQFIIRRRGRDEFNIWKGGEVFRNLRDIDVINFIRDNG